MLSRLALKTFRPTRRFTLEDGQLKEFRPVENTRKPPSNVVKLSEQKLLESKMAKVGDES